MISHVWTMEHASVNPGQNTLVNAQLSTKVKIVKVSCICPPYGGCETLKTRCLYPDQLLKKKIQITLFTFYFIRFGWPYGLTETYGYVYIYVYVYILMSLTLSISTSLSMSMTISRCIVIIFYSLSSLSYFTSETRFFYWFIVSSAVVAPLLDCFCEKIEYIMS